MISFFKYSALSAAIFASLGFSLAFCNNSKAGFSLDITNNYLKTIKVRCYAQNDVIIDNPTSAGERDFQVAPGAMETVTGQYFEHKGQEQDIIGCWELGYDAHLSLLVLPDLQESIDTSDANPGFVVDDAGTGLVDFEKKGA